MKIKSLLAGLAVCASVSAFADGSLTESTFTEIIKQANVVAATDKTVTPAQVSEVFHAPDLVRTGPESRLEMTAPDKTITRVGENSVFTFEQGQRDIRLEKGSVLFHPPAGVGGGIVQHGGTAAAVLGTTMVCSVLPDGSFKIMILEGHSTVTLANGNSMDLSAGQMLIVPPDGNSFGPVTDVNLAKLVPHLLLINGFSDQLSSMPLINDAIQLQKEQIAAGKQFNFAPLQEAEAGLESVFNTFGDMSILLNTHDSTTIRISPTSGTKD